MTLSKLTEDFLKYIIEEKKPKDLVDVQEEELPDEFKNQIFGLADELEDEKLIENLRKYGKPGTRGTVFFILPKGLSYFESKKEMNFTPSIANYYEGAVTNIYGDSVSNKKNDINISKEEKEKSKFEKYWFPMLLAIITGIFVCVAALIGKEPVLPPQPPLITKTENILSTDAPTLTSTENITLVDAPTLPPIENNIPNICSFSDGPVTVGVIDLGVDYVYTDIFDRLKELGLQPTWISPNSTYNDFIKYDVVYLPSGWSIQDSSLELHPKYLQDYVKINGGGLIVEQPNSKRELSPAFLPYKISFITNKMDLEDWPVIIYDPSTSLTSGLELSDLPGPMDCAEMDSSYATIVKGSKTGCTSLAITSYGEGRILINMGNSSPSMESNGLPTISDIALCRMFGWVTKE